MFPNQLKVPLKALKPAANQCCFNVQIITLLITISIYCTEMYIYPPSANCMMGLFVFP